ncbi:MAG: hypothetical protein H0U52_07910 [Chloroflexi bacterium]|nr:hypothetical protein [Chloroflexota bacterium]
MRRGLINLIGREVEKHPVPSVDEHKELSGVAFRIRRLLTGDARSSFLRLGSFGKAMSEIGERREEHVRALIPGDLSSTIR